MWVVRVGLIFDVIGAVIIAADLVGQQRLEHWEGKLKGLVNSYRSPKASIENLTLQGYFPLYAMFIVGVALTVFISYEIYINSELVAQIWAGWFLFLGVPLILAISILFSYLITFSLSVALYVLFIPLHYLFIFQKRVMVKQRDDTKFYKNIGQFMSQFVHIFSREYHDYPHQRLPIIGISK